MKNKVNLLMPVSYNGKLDKCLELTPDVPRLEEKHKRFIQTTLLEMDEENDNG